MGALETLRRAEAGGAQGAHAVDDVGLGGGRQVADALGHLDLVGVCDAALGDISAACGVALHVRLIERVFCVVGAVVLRARDAPGGLGAKSLLAPDAHRGRQPLLFLVDQLLVVGVSREGELVAHALRVAATTLGGKPLELHVAALACHLLEGLHADKLEVLVGDEALEHLPVGLVHAAGDMCVAIAVSRHFCVSQAWAPAGLDLWSWCLSVLLSG